MNAKDHAAEMAKMPIDERGNRMSAPSRLKVFVCPIHGGVVSTERPCREVVAKYKDGRTTYCHQAEEVEVIPASDFQQAADEIANYTNLLHAEQEAHFKTRDERNEALADAQKVGAERDARDRLLDEALKLIDKQRDYDALVTAINDRVLRTPEPTPKQETLMEEFGEEMPLWAQLAFVQSEVERMREELRQAIARRDVPEYPSIADLAAIAASENPESTEEGQ